MDFRAAALALLAFVLLAGLGAMPLTVASARAADPACLTPAEASEAVAAHRVVPPGQALVAVRKSVPNADILRANLCHDPSALVYKITALRQDGRLVRVTVDAPSGKVKTLH